MYDSREKDRINRRLRESSCRGRDIYQEYLVSIIVRHKDTAYGHSVWQKKMEEGIKKGLRNNDSVKSVKVLKGLKRSPEMAACEDDWLEM